MSEGNVAFEEMLQTCQDACEEAFKGSLEFSSWMPPAGKYTVQITGTKPFKYKSQGTELVGLSISHQIIDGAEDVKGNKFQFAIFPNNSFRVESLRQLAGLLGTQSDRYGVNGAAVSKGAVDGVFIVEKTTTNNPKNPEAPFDGVNYLSKLS